MLKLVLFPEHSSAFNQEQMPTPCSRNGGPAGLLSQGVSGGGLVPRSLWSSESRPIRTADLRGAPASSTLSGGWVDRSPRKGVTRPVAHKAQRHLGLRMGQSRAAPVRGSACAVSHHGPWPCWGLTFPHGQGQDGSPGLEAFHRAKSLGDRFSLRRSAEMLRSPADRRAGRREGLVGGACQRVPSHPKAVPGTCRALLTNFRLLSWSSTPFTLTLCRLWCCRRVQIYNLLFTAHRPESKGLGRGPDLHLRFLSPSSPP